MKKLLALILTSVLMLIVLISCSLFTHKKNQWFSEEKLEECILPDMPQLDCDFVKEGDEVIYANLTEEGFDNYLTEIYAFLVAKNFEHLGTRGEEASSLSGAFVSYYLEPATELSEFYVDGAYRFIYSDGQISMSIDEDSDDFTFCILTIAHYGTTKTVEYGLEKFNYNCKISLKFNSEYPLSGRYELKEHEHTGEWIRSETTHFYQYTCGCPSPDIAELHLDGDGDGKCDICKYVILKEGNYFLRNQSGCEWMNEIIAEDISEIKIINEYVGVAPGNFKSIQSSIDKAVIARVFEEYYSLDTTPIPEQNGQIAGGSAVAAKFIFRDGTEKELYINNGNYRDTYGNYFDLFYTPKFNDADNATSFYGFTSYVGTVTVYDSNNTSVCKIPTIEFEFAELTEGFDDFSAKQKYCVETEFGNLVFFTDAVFYIDYPVQGHTDFYQLVGKNLDELIAEYSFTTE